MKLKEFGEFCLSWEEDLDKEISIDFIPYRTKMTDLSISDDGTKKAIIYYVKAKE